MWLNMYWTILNKVICRDSKLGRILYRLQDYVTSFFIFHNTSLSCSAMRNLFKRTLVDQVCVEQNIRHWKNDFGGTRTRVGRVESTNATTVLCRPPIFSLIMQLGLFLRHIDKQRQKSDHHSVAVLRPRFVQPLHPVCVELVELVGRKLEALVLVLEQVPIHDPLLVRGQGSFLDVISFDGLKSYITVGSTVNGFA